MLPLLLLPAFKGLAAAQVAAGHASLLPGLCHALASPHAALAWMKAQAHAKMGDHVKEVAVEEMIKGIPESPAKVALRAALMDGGALSLSDVTDMVLAAYPDEGKEELDDGAVEQLLEQDWDATWSAFAANLWDTGAAVSGAPRTSTLIRNGTDVPLSVSVCNMGKLMFVSVMGEAVAKDVKLPPGHWFEASSDKEMVGLKLKLAPMSDEERAGLPYGCTRGSYAPEEKTDIPAGSQVTIGYDLLDGFSVQVETVERTGAESGGGSAGGGVLAKAAGGDAGGTADGGGGGWW